MRGCLVFRDCALDNLPVFFNLINDGKADLQRSAGLFPCHPRCSSVPYAVNERLELQTQWLLILNLRLLKGNVAVADGHAGEFLPGIVNGDVLPWLKQAQFPDLLDRDAAGSEVRDTTIGKRQTDIRNI